MGRAAASACSEFGYLHQHRFQQCSKLEALLTAAAGLEPGFAS